MKAYQPNALPLAVDYINQNFFMEELIDATSKLEVYKEKLKDSKLDHEWFLPTLQQKEALASSVLEGTQATLDEILSERTKLEENRDSNLREVYNYFAATEWGFDYLKNNAFDEKLISNIHRILMKDISRSNTKLVGEYRNIQNHVINSTPNSKTKKVSYTPPEPKQVRPLMENLINYIQDPKDNYRSLVRIAIIHAQFETIHPFVDGNGRVGRIIIPLYLFKQEDITLPCLFVSEALERDKIIYYNSLNRIRTDNCWNEWIKFFLLSVKSQCEKYIDIVRKINDLYEQDLDIAKKVIKSAKIVDLINLLYEYPVINANVVSLKIGMPTSTINRYLNILEKEGVLFSEAGVVRNRHFYYYKLMRILRE